MEKTQQYSHYSHDTARRVPRRDSLVSQFFLRTCIALFLFLSGYGLFHYGRCQLMGAGVSDDNKSSTSHDEASLSPLSATLSDSDASTLTTAEEASIRVPLEAHIMSKCPDAQYCLQQLVVPAMEQIHDKVDFRLSFIGSISNESSGVACMHGPPECVGNILILCAANLPFPPTLSGSQSYPRTPTIRSLGFANCLISSYDRIPERELVEDCALEHGIDFEAMNRCASRQDEDEGGDGDPDKISGIALLRRSIRRNLDAGIARSCTVRLDNQIWCVRDGGLWKDCVEGHGSSVSVLVNEAERLWKERN